MEKDVSKLLIPALEAFSGTDTLVIATTGGNATAELKHTYKAENLIIEDYIPFTDVMRYATVFVTNGGYSGTLLAIKHGLPIVAAGVHEGKNEVCARIGYFDLGINLGTETPSAAALTEAVERIIFNQKYKNNVAGLFQELNNLNPYEQSVQYIEELLIQSVNSVNR